MSYLKVVSIIFSQAVAVGKNVLQGAKHQCERCPELVTYVAEKQRLDAIDFRQGLSTFLLVFVSTCIRNTRCNLSSNEIEKSSVAHVERTIRVEPGHHDAGRSGLCLTHHGQEERSTRWTIPHTSW